MARLGGDEFALLLEDVHAAEVSSACDRILAALGRGRPGRGPPALACRPASASPSATAARPPRACCATPTWRCTRPSPAARTSTSSTSAPIGRSRLQRLELVESLRSSVDRRRPGPRLPADRARRAPAGSPASRRWPAGSRTASTCRPTSSSASPRTPASWWPLGDVVLEHAARDAPAIVQAAGGDVNVCVNISAKQLREPDFVADRARAGADGRRRAGARDHRAGRHRQRPGVPGGDAGPRRPRRPVRHRRLRGRLLLDRLPAGHAGADHQDRPVVLREHRPRRALVRRCCAPSR